MNGKYNKAEILLVRQAPPISKLDRSEMLDAMQGVMQHISVLTGMKWSVDDWKLIKDELISYVTGKYEYLTMGEVSVAVQMGCRGELGNRSQYPTPAAVENWIATYAESEERRVIVEEEYKARRKAEGQKALPDVTTADRNREFYCRYPIEMFEAVKAGDDRMGLSREVGNKIAEMVYDYLDGQGKFCAMSDQTRRDAEAAAEEFCKAGSKFSQGILAENDESLKRMQVKYLLLLRYFKALIAAGRELEYELK